MCKIVAGNDDSGTANMKEADVGQTFFSLLSTNYGECTWRASPP
jgi:hypothetical protein